MDGETRDAVAVTLRPPEQDRAAFAMKSPPPILAKGWYQDALRSGYSEELRLGVWFGYRSRASSRSNRVHRNTSCYLLGLLSPNTHCHIAGVSPPALELFINNSFQILD